MFYFFKDKHRLLEVKLEFKGQNCMFNSYEMELYSVLADFKENQTLLWFKNPYKKIRETKNLESIHEYLNSIV
jgi:hypothetical protein